jgi:hypothetical protein
VRGESHRPLPPQRNPQHHPPKPVIVIHRVVLHAAVVPERDGVGLPHEAAGELRLHLVRKQELQQRRAFFVGHAGDAGGVRHVHVQRLAAGLGVRAGERGACRLP